MDHPLSSRALTYFDELFPLDPPAMTAQTALRNPEQTSILDDIESFDAFGAKTRIEVRDDIPYFTNEFWTSGQRQGHSLHEVSYRACFKPQLPEFWNSIAWSISRSLTLPGCLGRLSLNINLAIRTCI